MKCKNLFFIFPAVLFCSIGLIGCSSDKWNSLSGQEKLEQTFSEGSKNPCYDGSIGSYQYLKFPGQGIGITRMSSGFYNFYFETSGTYEDIFNMYFDAYIDNFRFDSKESATFDCSWGLFYQTGKSGLLAGATIFNYHDFSFLSGGTLGSSFSYSITQDDLAWALNTPEKDDQMATELWSETMRRLVENITSCCVSEGHYLSSLW